MIRLHQYPAYRGPGCRELSSLSPFCIKVEAYLRLRGLGYESVVETNPARGPRGRMPFVEDHGTVRADSSQILEAYESVGGRAALDHGLSSEERAVSFAFHRLLDLDLYRVILYSRWVDPAGWKVLRREFAAFFPPGLRTIALGLIRQSLVKEACGSGILEMSREEIYALGERQLRSISDQLGERKYFFGNRVRTIDASLFAFLGVILHTPIPVPLRECARGLPNLVAYEARMADLIRKPCTRA